MNRSHRRLLRHHRPARLPAVPLPALALAGTPRAAGDRVEIDVRLPGFDAVASVPARPAGWLLVAAGADAAPLLPDGWATLRVGGSADALTAAAAWLRALPETRGLPLALAGSGDRGRTAALHAAVALGPRVAALVLDGPADGPVVLTPTTVVNPGDAHAAAAALAPVARTDVALNHRARRRLAHGLERCLRREQRRRGGARTRQVRAGIALLAGALSLGLLAGAAPAGAAFTTSFSGGTLKVDSDNAGDSIAVTCGLTGIEVNAVTAPPGPPVPCASVTSIIVSGAGGNDTLRALVDGATLPGLASVQLDGGTGEDVLQGLNAGSTELTGGADADSLTGATTANTLVGGAGNDTITGGAATDTAQFPGSATVNVNLGTGSAVSTGADAGTDSVASIETVTGTSGNDTLTGTGGPELLTGSGGADTLFGVGGADTLNGGAGTDALSGGAGQDSLLGGTEDDRLQPGADADTVDGGGGTDLIEETLPAAGELDLSTFSLVGNGTDTLTSIETASLTGSGSPDTLDVTAFDGPVTLNGSGGNDTLVTSAFTHDDSLVGGSGDDLLDYRVAANASISTTQVVGNGTDAISSFERASLAGGNGDNTITVGSFTGPTTLSGGNNNDSLEAGSGATSLTGGDGDDSLEAGSGAASLSGGNDADTLVAGNGPTTVTGGNGTDLLVFRRNADATLSDTGIAATGADVAFSGTMPELASLEGGSAANVISAASFTGGPVTINGSSGADTLTGSPQADALTGGIGDDALLGGAGPDTLRATFGDDVLQGEAGDDSLDGGTDASTLSGGADNDRLTAVFGTHALNGGAGVDTVTTALGLAITLTDTSIVKDGATIATLADVDAVAYNATTNNQLIDASALTLPATLNAGQGDDTVVAGSAAVNDELTGGEGTDELRRTSDTDQTLSPTRLTGGGTDVLSEFERASLAGGAAGNRLDASTFTGPVTLSGLGGPDTLIGGLAIDNLLGGAGDDAIDSRDTGVVDAVDCGADTDSLLSDPADTQVACETVNGASTAPPPDPVPPPPGPPPPADSPPPVGAGMQPAGDTAPPRLTLTGARTLRPRGKTLKVTTTFACDEACTASATGSVVITRRVKVAGRPRTRTTRLPLSGAAARTTAAGRRGALTLTLNATRTKTLLRLLRQRTTTRVTVPLRIVAADTAGNRTAPVRRTIRITKPSARR